MQRSHRLQLLLPILVLAACDHPTRPAEPSIARPGAAVAAVEQRFTVRDLGTLGGERSGGAGINEQVEVVGFAELRSGTSRAFLWRPGRGMRSLGTLGGARSFAESINDRTEVVGGSEIRPGSFVTRAFLWSEAGGMRGLGTLGGRNSFANAINNRREVVGVSDNQNGRPRAFLWRPGRGMRSLGTLGGVESRAFDINDATQVVGSSRTGAAGNEHAFLWTAARGMEDLGTLGGSRSVALGISQTGVVVGFSTTDAAGTEEVFLWTRAGGMRSLGSLGGQFFNRAFSVNTHRRVVGLSQPSEPGSNTLPFLWTPGGGMRPLPQPHPGAQGRASYLNEFGNIAGSTFVTTGLPFPRERELHAVLWTPTAGPLVVGTTDHGAALEVVASPGGRGNPRSAACDLGPKLVDWSRSGMIASATCLGR